MESLWFFLIYFVDGSFLLVVVIYFFISGSRIFLLKDNRDVL